MTDMVSKLARVQVVSVGVQSVVVRRDFLGSLEIGILGEVLFCLANANS